MAQTELKFLQWLHETFGVVTPLARILTELGGEVLIFVLIAVVYFAVDKDKGEKIGLIVTLNACVNELLKLVFRRPRPFTYDDSLGYGKLPLKYESSYSFPSGHSQNGGATYMSVMIYFPKRWIAALSVTAMLIVPLTRMLLGVHFPTDAVVGLTLGVAFAVAFSFLLERIWFKRDRWYLCFAVGAFLIVFAVFLPLSFVTDVSFTGKIFGVVAGLSVGFVIEHRYGKMENAVGIKNKLLRLALALGTALALNLGQKLLYGLMIQHFTLDFLRYFLTMGVTMGVIPLCVRKLKI